MWIYTKHGQVSIVAHREHEGVYLVRSRTRAILQRLVDEHEEFFTATGNATGTVYRRVLNAARKANGFIVEMPEADYRYRMEVLQGELALIVSSLIGWVDYDNFKNAATDEAEEEETLESQAYVDHLHAAWADWCRREREARANDMIGDMIDGVIAEEEARRAAGEI